VVVVVALVWVAGPINVARHIHRIRGYGDDASGYGDGGEAQE